MPSRHARQKPGCELSGTTCQVDGASHLRQTCRAFHYARHAFLGQRTEILGKGTLAHFSRACAPRDKFVEIGIHVQDFHDRGAAAVAPIVAAIASHRPENLELSITLMPGKLALFHGRRIGFLAEGAEHPDQSLRDDSDNVAGHDVGRDADVQQSRKSAERRIGMKGREYLMAGHGGAKRHFRRFAIAYFADQDDVRILTHDRADTIGKIYLRHLRYGSLPHHRHRIFDRIFQRHDVHGFDVELGEQRIKGRCFAAPGRAGQYQNAFRASEHEIEFRHDRLGQFHMLQADHGFFAIEHAQNDVLAPDRGLGGHAEIHRPTVQVERQSPVLRRACFGDIHRADDFDSDCNARPVVFVQAAYLLQHAVDAVADAQKGEFWLEVNIRGAALDGIDQQGADQPDDRLGVLVHAALLQALIVDFAGFDLPQDAVDGKFWSVELVEEFVELPLAGEHRLHPDVVPKAGAQLVQRYDIEYFGDGDDQKILVRVVGDGQQAMATCKFLRDQFECFGIHQYLGKIDTFLTDGPRHDVADDRFGDEAEPDQKPPDRHVLGFLLGERNAQLIVGDQALLNQQLFQTQPFALLGHLG